MVQLWVNLPAKDKMAPPRYQGILSSQIPTVALPDGRGSVRVIAGAYAGTPGPAQTFTPVQVWDLRLDGAEVTDFPVPDGYTTMLAVLRGRLSVQGEEEPIRSAEIAMFDRAGDAIRIDTADNAVALLLAGQPIDEPIVGQGPFVMNTPQEIRQAIVDYQSGKMGHLS
jgi:redox-sensitive bicupin YhaK (pirin superfamily)